MAKINLYGRELDLYPVWMLSQGYCEWASNEAVRLAELGQYAPADGAPDWLVAHVQDCRQCTMANALKATIMEYLEKKHQDWVERYRQGYTPPREVIVGWVGWIVAHHRSVAQWYLSEFPKLMAPHMAEWERLYGQTGK